MFKWTIPSGAGFVLGEQINSLLQAAKDGQSLTYQGVSIGLIILLATLIVWFARIQFVKEERLSDRLVKLGDETSKLYEKLTEHTANTIRDNTQAMQSLKHAVDTLTSDIRRIDEHQQDAAKEAAERDRRRRGVQP